MSNHRTLARLGWTLMLLAPFYANAASVPRKWNHRVPRASHIEKNPVGKTPDVIAEGRQQYDHHCAGCHGPQQQGTNRAPALRTSRVQRRVTEGDLHWLLENGNQERGMPSWSKLGDPELWKIIAYLRSLR